MNKLSLSCLGALFLVAASSGTARAVTFFTDFAAFDAVTTTTIVEDFEGVASPNALLSSLVSNGNTYTPFAGVPFNNVVVTTPGQTNFGVPVTTSSILTANGDENFRIDFGMPTQVVGFDTYLNAAGPATVEVFGSGGLLNTFILNPDDPTVVGFLGIVAEETIQAIRWETIGGGTVNTGIDNIRQGTSIDVPEPATVFGLFVATAVGFGWSIERWKNKNM